MNKGCDQVTLFFYADEAMNTADQTRIRFRQVILDDANKIAGKKPVIFNINKIFNDPDALVFSYHSTLFP